MSFYGFDSEDDFIRYHLLTDDDSDDAGSHESADNETVSGTTGRMRGGRRRPKEPTPEELKRRREREEMKRRAQKAEKRQKLKMEIFLLLYRIAAFLLICWGVWSCLSESQRADFKERLFGQEEAVEDPYDGTDYVVDDTCIGDSLVSNDTVWDNPESDAEYAESQAQIWEMQARERGGASYSGGSYSEDWGDDYDYDEEHDDVDTWYGGDDDADMYWEYDYHE